MKIKQEKMKNIFKKIIVAIITFEASIVIKKYKPKIVAVTGCVGKTSTKDAIAAVLKSNFSARESRKSYNSEIGLPLTVLGCESGWLSPLAWLKNIYKGALLILLKKEYPEWLVLEMGIEKPKDMDKLVKLAKPHIAVITALADIPSHVEFFAGPKSVAKEKAKILKDLEVDDYAILNGDDDTALGLKEKTKAKIVTFGFGGDADFVSSKYSIVFSNKDGVSRPEGITFKVDFKGSSVPVRINGAFGKHHVYPALTALAVGLSAGLNLVETTEALSSYNSPPGRLKLLDGIKNSYILDDTYNSSPLALRAALEVLHDIPAKRKIAVLGDMLELGKYTIEAHKSMAEFVTESGAEIVFTVGPRAKFIAESLRENNFDDEKIFVFSDSEQVKKELQEVIREEDLILIKGSQGMRMEKIVEEVMAEPEKKTELLVRQSKAWKNK